MAATRAFTPHLPAELQHMIFIRLPKSDLKNLRLSNKQWSASAATILWKELTVDLIDSDTRKIVAILDSDPNGILDNVKNLSISTIESGLSHLSQQQAKLSLVSLLGALPRDCLSAFTSNDYALSKYELGILLRNQTQIETLESPVTTKKGDPPGPNDIKGKLSLLKTLVVEVFGTEHFAYQGYNHWFAHAPKLRNLRIKGSALSELNHFDAWALPDQTPLLKLLVLTLDNVRLSKSTKSIVDCLYLPDLLHLEIHECDNIEPLLRSFTTAFKKTHRMSLETLEIFDSRSSESLSGVVEEFLGAVTSIRTVKLDFTNGDLIKPESLMGCGQTIETLEIYHYDAEIRYTLHELRKLTSSCPNLTRIGLNLVDLRNTIAALQPFESLCVSTSAYSGPESDEFAKSLQVLAQLPKLLELRLMHRPWMSHIINAAERRWRHSQVADQIMRILADNGSHAHTLQIDHPCEYHDGVQDDVVDESGHIWPNYTYKRGTVSLFGDASAETRTVAVPV